MAWERVTAFATIAGSIAAAVSAYYSMDSANISREAAISARRSETIAEVTTAISRFKGNTATALTFLNTLSIVADRRRQTILTDGDWLVIRDLLSQMKMTHERSLCKSWREVAETTIQLKELAESAIDPNGCAP